MRSRWSALVAASLLLGTALFLASPTESDQPALELAWEHQDDGPSAPAQAGAPPSGPRTEIRQYAVAAGTSATGGPNCDQQTAPNPAPAVDAACFSVQWPGEDTVEVAVADELRDQVFLRASFHDSGGLHLKTNYLCSGGTLEVPIWAAELQVWIQPSWAGALNTVDEHVGMAGAPCEPQWGTSGIVTAVFS